MLADQLRIAHQVLAVLESGSKKQTYKFALLVALIDEVAEGVDQAGLPPRWTTGSRLAERALRLYWEQTRAIDSAGHASQSDQPGGLVDKAATSQALARRAGWMSFDSFATGHSDEARQLRAEARRAICSYAIPLLQRFGSGATAVDAPFLYEPWAEGRLQHRDERGDRLDFLPGVPEALLTTGPLLRRVVEMEWLQFVRKRNLGRVGEPVLERALFGAVRLDLGQARDVLVDIDGDVCKWCGGRQQTFEVDHFLPWSLSRDDSLENLVLVCGPCNNDKRAQLAGDPPLDRWLTRSSEHASALRAAAESIRWPHNPERTRARARGLYRAHAEAGIPLWTGRKRPPSQIDLSSVLERLTDSS